MWISRGGKRGNSKYKNELKEEKKNKKILGSLKKNGLIPESIYGNEIDTIEKIDINNR